MTWLRDWSLSDDVALRLLCLHPAGSAAHVYRRWPRLLPPDIGVVAAELPGHGSRLAEPPLETMDEILKQLCAEAGPLTDRPLVLFGHSMGGTLAAELARYLRRELGVTPRLLIVAACEAPRREPRRDYARWLTEDGVLAYLHEMGGTPPELLAHKEFLEMTLPVLRADLTVLAGPRPVDDRPVDCPVRLYLGERDTTVREDRALAWREESDGDFTVRRFDGGHFFVQEQVADVVARVRADVEHLRMSTGNTGRPS
ncbi:thioesterase II family protein [Streptomyces muensis]|uniref:Alpha/beta fold hydrolase n=1 Tax=Streptomyces muensis TaxID=1077944 RepID=A0A9X1Q1H8_STRM4|nr:alpha/beta fold hydrolase [Streptomyces muensis]MCF1596903.1 alpha/beta fold hydrolase [Streptomyces muensis]